jgi:hypothetical protein
MQSRRAMDDQQQSTQRHWHSRDRGRAANSVSSSSQTRDPPVPDVQSIGVGACAPDDCPATAASSRAVDPQRSRGPGSVGLMCLPHPHRARLQASLHRGSSSDTSHLAPASLPRSPLIDSVQLAVVRGRPHVEQQRDARWRTLSSSDQAHALAHVPAAGVSGKKRPKQIDRISIVRGLRFRSRRSRDRLQLLEQHPFPLFLITAMLPVTLNCRNNCSFVDKCALFSTRAT